MLCTARSRKARPADGEHRSLMVERGRPDCGAPFFVGAMAVKSRLDPIDRSIQLFISEELSPEARSRHLASFARVQIQAAKDQNRRVLGADPPVEIAVDGSLGRPIEAVSPDGVVVAEFRLVEDVLAYIGEMLVRHSPVLSGRFQSSHILFADGVEVDPEKIPVDAQEYSFVNQQPYSRKIERGLSPQSPEGVYHVVSVLAQRRYGNIARIRFGFRSLPAGAVGRWSVTGSARALAQRVRGGDARNHPEWLTRQPAIVVTQR